MNIFSAGNATVIYVILRHRKMRNVTNFFLANLAASDLCVGVFCVLPNLSTFLSPYWMLGVVSYYY
jgi:hypocretin (orexin) receptor 2